MPVTEKLELRVPWDSQPSLQVARSVALVPALLAQVRLQEATWAGLCEELLVLVVVTFAWPLTVPAALRAGPPVRRGAPGLVPAELVALFASCLRALSQFKRQVAGEELPAHSLLQVVKVEGAGVVSVVVGGGLDALEFGGGLTLTGSTGGPLRMRPSRRMQVALQTARPESLVE